MSRTGTGTCCCCSECARQSRAIGRCLAPRESAATLRGVFSASCGQSPHRLWHFRCELDGHFTNPWAVIWTIWEGEAPAEPGSAARQEPRPPSQLTKDLRNGHLGNFGFFLFC